jgi:hypothetical protein
MIGSIFSDPANQNTQYQTHTEVTNTGPCRDGLSAFSGDYDLFSSQKNGTPYPFPSDEFATTKFFNYSS